MSDLHLIKTASKCFKVVIARLDRAIQKELDAPIKPEHDIFVYLLAKGINFDFCNDIFHMIFYRRV